MDGYFTGPIHPAADTVFADVYPVYLIKRASTGSSRRQQGDAIDERFNAYIDYLPDTALGRPGPATLPTRPGPSDLPTAAADRFGPWILDLLRAVGPELVVTLGQEPWTTLGLIPGLRMAHPCTDLAGTRTRGYGQPGTLNLDGQDIDWIPLAHPGLLNSPAADRGAPPASVHDDYGPESAAPSIWPTGIDSPRAGTARGVADTSKGLRLGVGPFNGDLAGAGGAVGGSPNVRIPASI